MQERDTLGGCREGMRGGDEGEGGQEGNSGVGESIKSEIP